MMQDGIYSLPYTPSTVSSPPPVDLSFLGDQDVKLTEESDLTKIAVKLIPCQKESSYHGEPICLPLSILEPWPSLFHPFLSFNSSRSGVLEIETNFETLSILVEFLKAWDPSPSLDQSAAFTILDDYLNSTAPIQKSDEKEKETETMKELTHPFNKALELFLLANYLNIEPLANFSSSLIQSKNFLDTIDEEASKDLMLRLNGPLMADEFTFTWQVLFLRACQAKRYDHAKLLLDFYLKKYQLDDLRNWIQKPHFSEEVLPFLIKMILNVEDKTTPDFDDRMNFAIYLLHSYYNQVLYSHEPSLTNTSFFYSLFSIASAVESANQGSRLLQFFVPDPSKELTPTPRLSPEEKIFLENNNIYTSHLKSRDSVISFIIFKEIARVLALKNKPVEILIVLKKLCSQLQLRENTASIFAIVRSIFVTFLMNSSSGINYLKNLDLLFMLEKTVRLWLPSYTGDPGKIFNSSFFKEDYPNLKVLNKEDILRIKGRVEHDASIARTEKDLYMRAIRFISKKAKRDLGLYRPLIKAIKCINNPSFTFIKNRFPNEVNYLLKLFRLNDPLLPDCKTIFDLISRGEISEAILHCFENSILDHPDFYSKALQKLEVEKFFNFVQHLAPTQKNFFLKEIMTHLLNNQKWDEFRFYRQKIADNEKFSTELINYLINTLIKLNKRDVDQSIQIFQFLIHELNLSTLLSKLNEAIVSINIFKILNALMKTKDRKTLSAIVDLSHQFEKIKFFDRSNIKKFKYKATAARLLLGEGKKIIEELKGVKAKCTCLDYLGATVDLIKTSSLPIESVQALLSFAFHPAVIAEIKKKPRPSAQDLYPFLYNICCRLAFTSKMQGNETLCQEMNNYINIISVLGYSHFSREHFNLTGDIDSFFLFKSELIDEDFNTMLLKTGKFLAKMKNEQLFLAFAKRCDLYEFQTLSEAYFSTRRKLINPEESQNATACPANFFNALVMSTKFPIQGIEAVRKKRKFETEPPSLEKEKETEEQSAK